MVASPPQPRSVSSHVALVAEAFLLIIAWPHSHQIMKELVDDGPLVVSIKPAHDMMYYRSGVYRSDLERDSYHRNLLMSES